MENFKIPEISKEKLDSMYETLKPMVYDKEHGCLRYIELNIEAGNLTNKAFVWEPIFAPISKSKRPELIAFDSAKFLSSSYLALWKPSVAEVFAFIQNNEELLKDAVAFSVEHIAIHESGSGNIGLATFYKRARPIAKEKEVKSKLATKAKKIKEKFQELKALEKHHPLCSCCNSRLDKITTITPDWLGDKIDNYNNLILKYLKTHEVVDKEILEKLKFKLLNKLLNDAIREEKKG